MWGLQRSCIRRMRLGLTLAGRNPSPLSSSNHSLPTPPMPFSDSAKGNTVSSPDPQPLTFKHLFELLLISWTPTPSDPWKCKLSKEQQVALFHLLNSKKINITIFNEPKEKKRILDSLFRLGLCSRNLTTYSILHYGTKRANSYSLEYRRCLIRSIGW